MSYWKNLIKPNLDDDPKHPLYVYDGGKILTDWCGWCLAVLKAAFGATKSMGNAYNAWCKDQTQHPGFDLPENVYVPIWWKGGEKNYGHCAFAYRTGNHVKIWSSPYTHKPYYQIFEGDLQTTINNMTKTYCLDSFLGWTERVVEKQVIQYVPNDDASPVPTIPDSDSNSSDSDNSTSGSTDSDSQPNDDKNKNDDESGANGDVAPVKEADTQLIGELIEEASSVFNPSDTVKIIAYLIGDAFLVGAVLTPNIINMIQAPTLTIWGEYLSRTLMEAGVLILLIFKLIKKGKK